MVAANLPEHAPVPEMTSLTRTAVYLIERDGKATEPERCLRSPQGDLAVAKLIEL